MVMDGGTVRTICQICHANCGLVVRRAADGRLSLKGDPAHPMNRGRCCRKAAANLKVLRSADRLRYPLWRSPAGFKRVSWEEALRIAAERLGEIRGKYGPLSLARCTGAPVSYRARDGFLQFMGAFGSPNLTGVGNVCMAPRMTAFKAVTGGARTEPDYDRTRLVLFWGCNPLGAERFSSYAAHDGFRKILPRLKARGVKIVCIDPFPSQTAKAADAWIRIDPGSDVALGLAMIRVIIEEKLYDRGFVGTWTHGFAELARHVEGADPAWAEGRTGIPARTIAELARSYATTKPAVIYEGNGLDMHTGGLDAVRTIASLICLTGNLDVPGGNVFMPFPQAAALPTRPAPKEKRLWYGRFPLLPQVPFTALKEALLAEEEERPRAMIVHHGNPVLIQANERRTRQALQKLDFLIVSDIFPTATTEIADLVLPATAYFESWGYRAYSSAEGGFLALGRPIAEPAGEARSVFEVEYSLAQKLGLAGGYPFRDDRSWIEYMISPSGVALDRLEAEQIVYATGAVEYAKYLHRGFDTPSGKAEFYSQWFAKLGANPLPVYRDPAGEPPANDPVFGRGFPLLGTSRKPSQFVHTKFRNLPAVCRAYPEPLVYLHPADASARRIRGGQVVEVASPVGKITLRARISRETKPGLVWIDFGWGNPSDGKANINILASDERFDPVSGGTPNRLFRCEVSVPKPSAR